MEMLLTNHYLQTPVERISENLSPCCSGRYRNWQKSWLVLWNRRSKCLYCVRTQIKIASSRYGPNIEVFSGNATAQWRTALNGIASSNSSSIRRVTYQFSNQGFYKMCCPRILALPESVCTPLSRWLAIGQSKERVIIQTGPKNKASWQELVKLWYI